MLPLMGLTAPRLARVMMVLPYRDPVRRLARSVFVTVMKRHRSYTKI
ncbi:hypothetical protein AWB71_03150 [Caballeronia peredens]|nr:hypothetical protein AWB71_03150 [Caballeronia peredens]